jgi:hypothetical protein
MDMKTTIEKDGAQNTYNELAKYYKERMPSFDEQTKRPIPI